jgi:hypothetical protein
MKRKSAGCSQRSCPHLTATPFIGLMSFAGATPNSRNRWFQTYDCASLAAGSVSGLRPDFDSRRRFWANISCNFIVMFQPAEDVARGMRRICNCESLACRALTSAAWPLTVGRVSTLFFAVTVLHLVMITTSAESYWKRTTDPKNGQQGGRTDRFRTPGPPWILTMRHGS